MNVDMKHYVITIARQYGSGGRTVGQMLADRLGIHYYDRELLKLASDASGINEQLFDHVDERVSGILAKVAKKVYNGELIPPDSDDFTSSDNLFNYQAKIIRELAEQDESCVIIGRCADYVLKDYDNVLSVFIHAPKEFCLDQAAKKVCVRGRELERYVAKTDKYRADYYKYHTGREWTDARNYDLCLNSSKLGFMRCVEEIIAYKNVRLGHR